MDTQHNTGLDTFEPISAPTLVVLNKLNSAVGNLAAAIRESAQILERLDRPQSDSSSSMGGEGLRSDPRKQTSITQAKM